MTNRVRPIHPSLKTHLLQSNRQYDRTRRRPPIEYPRGRMPEGHVEAGEARPLPRLEALQASEAVAVALQEQAPVEEAVREHSDARPPNN